MQTKVRNGHEVLSAKAGWESIKECSVFGSTGSGRGSRRLDLKATFSFPFDAARRFGRVAG